MFTHLHVHSAFSFLYGTFTPEALVQEGKGDVGQWGQLGTSLTNWTKADMGGMQRGSDHAKELI
ncbi:MAG: hypothetical protein KAV83_06605 [Desulfobacterales bacterium]|nr:hypothetical protein [Desulfobacterales bacterium]